MTDYRQDKQNSFSRLRDTLQRSVTRTPRPAEPASPLPAGHSPAPAASNALAPAQRSRQRQHFPGLPDELPFFVPRDGVRGSNLKSLAEDLEERRLQILCGPFGCGKTALALQYAHKYMQEGPYTRVFWLKTTTQPVEHALRQTFDQILLFQSGPDWTRNFLEKFKTYEEQFSEKSRWLLVIDEEDDQHPLSLEHLDFATQLRQQTSYGHIILTTRQIPAHNQYTSFARFINDMHNEQAEATELLLSAFFDTSLKRVKEDSLYPQRILLEDQQEMLAANTLVAELDYNPYMIFTTGQYMRQFYNRTPQSLLNLYRQTIQFSVQQLPLGKSLPRHNQLARAYNKLLAIRLADLQEICNTPGSKRLLMLCAFLNKAPLPRELINNRPLQPLDGKSGLHSDEEIQPLFNHAILRSDSTFLHLDKISRDLYHWHFHLPSDPIHMLSARDQQLENELREYQAYVIYTVSTVFPNPQEHPAEYTSYEPHIVKCIEYLENRRVREYIQTSTPFMLDTVFRFLVNLGLYLQQHPEKERSHTVQEISYQEKKEITLDAPHLFELALHIYDLWTQDEQNHPTRQLLLYSILPALHEYFLYQHDRKSLENIAHYYPDISDFTSSSDTAIKVHCDFACLKSDLNYFADAESQFQALHNRLSLPANADAQQTTLLARWQAENLLGQAHNLLRYASHNTNPIQSQYFYEQARKIYREEIPTILNKLTGYKNISQENRQHLDYIQNRCQMDNIALLLLKEQHTDISLPLDTIEKHRAIVDKNITTIAVSKDIPASTYLQIIVDLNNLAEAYRRLGQRGKFNTMPVTKNEYFKHSKAYSLDAINCYNYFLMQHREKHSQARIILQTIWANYQANPLFEISKEETPTRTLWDAHEKLI